MNDEESVNAFDERLREAKGKATLVAKMVGERDLDAHVDSGSSSSRVDSTSKAKASGKEMEDFAGLPVARKKG